MEQVNAVYYFVLSLVSLGRKLALFPWLRNNMVHCIHHEVILYSSPFKGCGCFRYSRDSLEMPPDFMSVYLPERLLHVWAVACLDSLDSFKFTQSLRFCFVFCPDGTDPRRSGNKHGVVVLGKTGLVNAPVGL